MSSSGLVALFSALIFVGAVLPAEAGPTHQSKPATKKVVKKKRPVVSHRAYLVPPPPAYTPAILPEAYMNANVDPFSPVNVEVQQIAQPENPYKQYIYCANENDMPQPRAHRDGVSTWTQPKRHHNNSNSKVSHL